MGKRRTHSRASILVKAMIAAVVVVGAAVTIYAVAPSGEPRPGATSAELAKAALTTFEITTTATGDLQARAQIEIRSELDSDSAILEIIPEGTVVKAGDLLLRLNGDQIQTQIEDETLRAESARADLVAAENAYEIQKSENDSKLRQAELKHELAKLALEQWEKGEDKQRRNDIQLALERAERNLERLTAKFEQNKALLKEGFLSQDQYDQDYIALLEAQAALQKANLEQQTYTSYQFPKDRKSKQSDVEEAAAELERVKRQNEIHLTSKDADRLNKRRQLSYREDRLKKLQTQLAACTIRAPSDGLVVYATTAGRNNWDETPFQVGRNVRPREALIVLPDTSVMVAVVKVHESLAGRIRAGQGATVKVDMLSGRVFSGRVESIGVLAETGDRWRDPNRREYSVRIAVDHANSDGTLRPSMRCEAAITLGRVEGALAVPLQSVFAEDQLRYVYVPKGAKFERRPVKVGRRSDNYAEILTGLEQGQRVLLREPGPGEILVAPWNPEQLSLVGFELSEEGKPVAIRAEAEPAPSSEPPMSPAGDPRRGRGGSGGERAAGGSPEGRRPGAGAGAGERGAGGSGESTESSSDGTPQGK